MKKILIILIGLYIFFIGTNLFANKPYSLRGIRYHRKIDNRSKVVHRPALDIQWIQFYDMRRHRWVRSIQDGPVEAGAPGRIIMVVHNCGNKTVNNAKAAIEVDGKEINEWTIDRLRPLGVTILKQDFTFVDAGHHRIKGILKPYHSGVIAKGFNVKELFIEVVLSSQADHKK